MSLGGAPKIKSSTVLKAAPELSHTLGAQWSQPTLPGFPQPVHKPVDRPSSALATNVRSTTTTTPVVILGSLL